MLPVIGLLVKEFKIDVLKRRKFDFFPIIFLTYIARLIFKIDYSHFLGALLIDGGNSVSDFLFRPYIIFYATSKMMLTIFRK